MKEKKNHRPQETQKDKAAAKPEAAPRGLRIAGKAVDFTADLAAGTVSTVFKVLGTVLLVLLLTGMMFACVFAYYVKTCLTPNLDLSLEDFKLNESSTIWYQDAAGEWRELIKLSGKENRVWVDYDDIPQ